MTKENTIEILEQKLALLEKEIKSMIQANSQRVEAGLTPERLYPELLFSVVGLLDSDMSKGSQS